MTMTAAQYQALLAMFNECNDDFWTLPQKTLDAFFEKLYSKD